MHEINIIVFLLSYTINIIIIFFVLVDISYNNYSILFLKKILVYKTQTNTLLNINKTDANNKKKNNKTQKFKYSIPMIFFYIVVEVYVQNIIIFHGFVYITIEFVNLNLFNVSSLVIGT